MNSRGRGYIRRLNYCWDIDRRRSDYGAEGLKELSRDGEILKGIHLMSAVVESSAVKFRSKVQIGHVH